MVKTKKYLNGILPVIVSIAIAVLFLSQPLAQAQQGAAPMTTQTTTGQVTPVLNTNVTWSLFNSSMSPNEYLNGSGDPQYLNAEPSMYNPNYITVNPADIQSSDLTKNISSVNWQDAANWFNAGSITGIVQSIQNTTYKGQKAIEYSFNSSAAGTTNLLAGLGLTWNQLPSQNLAYDYATITGFSNGSATNQIGILLNNQTGGNQYETWPQQISITNQSQITTTGVGSSNFQSNTPFYASFPISIANNIKETTSTGIAIGIGLHTLDETTTQTHVFITGLSVTTDPYYLGTFTNKTGTHEIQGSTNTVQASSFNPNFKWSEIANNGYTESLSQPLGMAQNLTETQAAISSGQYIEEVTQQAIMSFPTAPDLTYGPSNMTLEMNGINASQVTLINVNGVSYSSGLSGFNGTSFNIGTENPNSPNSVIIQIEYTAAQWNSFTSAPSFFSVAGIEYYWWIFIISTLGAVGLFAGLKSYATGKEETQRIVPPPRTR